MYGKYAKQIADELMISVHTATLHIKYLYKKLGINNCSEVFARLSSHSFSLKP